MSYRVALVKLLPEEYAEDFLSGSLYLNTFTYFSGLDQSDLVRSDPHDGASAALQTREVAIQDSAGNWLPIDGIQNPIIYRSNESATLNILCLYTLTDRPDDMFDVRNLSFGNLALFITNASEFVQRVRSAAASSNWQVEHGPVQYIERATHDGHIGPFRKFQEYSYQREFRFIFSTGKRAPCRLEVGCLRDIVRVTSSSEVAAIWTAMRNANA